MNSGTVEKYNQLAEGFAERTWANLPFDMRRRLTLTVAWGQVLHAGDSIVELGCGDGYLAELLVQHGFHYCGIDMSPNMTASADRRLQRARFRAEFLVADVSLFALAEPVDAVVSYMGAFFTFVHNPANALQRIRPYIRKKIIVDVNPRGHIPIASAIDILKAAGFKNITWRPFFVPVTKKLPEAVLKSLSYCETVPILRGLPLRWKFNVLLKGEVE